MTTTNDGIEHMECTKVAEEVFRCVSDQVHLPGWYLPVFVACFVMALAILVLTVVNMHRQKVGGVMNRRAEDRDIKVQLDHRKVE